MKLRKKLAALCMAGIMVLGQSLSVFAADFKLVSGWGSPRELGGSIHHSMTAVFSNSSQMYLKADMKVTYLLNGQTSASYYESAYSTNDSTKRKSAQAYKNWFDSGEATARVYNRYSSRGYTSANGTTWTPRLESSDTVASIQN